jgi:ABC-type nitrate/sulfonate/bicarbonate transport system ATPase subunit
MSWVSRTARRRETEPDHPVYTANDSSAPPPRLELVGVRKQFETRRGVLNVLDGIDLKVARGSFVSIIGPSGCGKSTMFSVVAGLDQPSAGEVLVDGEVATGVRDRFAFMPQKDLLFPWRKVIDNAALGLQIQGVSRKEARERAGKWFVAFGLEGFEHTYPAQLSGGMRQRAALLRTVVQGRPVLLLDEPFGALDSLTRSGMQEWLLSIWEQFEWTVLLVTHDIREAILLSDEVHVLSPRPAKVRLSKTVPLGRPRDAVEVMHDPGYIALETELTRALHGLNPL